LAEQLFHFLEPHPDPQRADAVHAQLPRLRPLRRQACQQAK
jgi:hypothetical protein